MPASMCNTHTHTARGGWVHAWPKWHLLTPATPRPSPQPGSPGREALRQQRRPPPAQRVGRQVQALQGRVAGQDARQVRGCIVAQAAARQVYGGKAAVVLGICCWLDVGSVGCAAEGEGARGQS